MKLKLSAVIPAKAGIHALSRIAITALAACALAPSLALAESKPPKLLIWINGDKGYNGLQKVGDIFTQKTGVNVVVEHPIDAPEKFQQAAGAGKGPDIFCWAHDRAGGWAKAGLVVPVRPTKATRSEVEDTAWQAFTYQGKIWGYPIAIETISLIYNKALVPNPPETFEDVIALDKALVQQGKKAILWDFTKAFFSWPIIAAGGGQVFGKDAKGEFDPKRVGVNTPGAIKAGELLESMVKNGQMPKGARYSQMEGSFAQGNLGMMISGPWAWDNAKKNKIDFGVAPIPKINGIPGKPFVGVLGCMISAPSKAKDIAREFLENHLLKIEHLKMVNADVPLGVPANKVFYAELASDPNISATMASARNGEPIPNIPEMGRFWGAMDAALEAITNGLQSPKDALNGAAARIATP
jgi:maltose/maltodextrin transport system substrate-binding protein